MRSILNSIGWIMIGIPLVWIGLCIIWGGIFGGSFSIHLNNPFK